MAEESERDDRRCSRLCQLLCSYIGNSEERLSVYPKCGQTPPRYLAIAVATIHTWATLALSSQIAFKICKAKRTQGLVVTRPLMLGVIINAVTDETITAAKSGTVAGNSSHPCLPRVVGKRNNALVTPATKSSLSGAFLPKQTIPGLGATVVAAFHASTSTRVTEKTNGGWSLRRSSNKVFICLISDRKAHSDRVYPLRF